MFVVCSLETKAKGFKDNLYWHIWVTFYIHLAPLWTWIALINATKYWSKGIDQGVHPIPAWISNYMPSKEWNEITYPFPNFNEVCEWINNFSPYCVMNKIIDPCWQKGATEGYNPISELFFPLIHHKNSANTGTFQSNCECLGISDYIYIYYCHFSNELQFTNIRSSWETKFRRVLA